MKNSKVTRSPVWTLRGAPPVGSLKSIVIGPHFIVAMGSCDKVIASLLMLSTLASPTCLGALAAAAPEGAAPDAGTLFKRASTPLKLASESIRNCDETTTRCPACKPRLTSVCPPLSMPISTSAGLKRPFSSASMTTVRLPVWMTASVGISSTLSARMSMNCIDTNMPGTSRAPGFASSSRAFKVRVVGLTSGRMACTLPSKASPGTAGLLACTLAPGRSKAAWLSGTSALAQTVESPLMRNSVAPGITVIPSLVVNSVMTPPIGAISVMRGCVRPVRATSSICPSLMPTCRMRWRAPSTNGAKSVPRMR